MSYESFNVITGALSADVAPTGTFTASYPSGKKAGNYFLALGHKLVVGSDTYYFPVDIDISFGASSMTITNKTSAVTWPQSAAFRLQVNELGERVQLDTPMQDPNAVTGVAGSASAYGINARAKLVPSTTQVYANLMTLGNANTLDDDGICAAQSMAASGTLTINGALATSATLVTLDVPRAVQVVSSGSDTAVVTVKGTDVYGQTMSEALTLNGATAVPGKKAFKTVILVTCGAAIANLAKVGTTDILGLPEFLPDIGFVIAEMQDGKKIGGAQSYQLPFFFGSVNLLAGTAQELVSPVNGYIRSAYGIVSDSTVATGGDVAFNVGGVAVTGLTLTVTDGATPGTVFSDVPTTAFSSTTAITRGARITVAPGSTFATSGALNGFVEVTGTVGTTVAGIRTAGGSTTTTGDTRGTYKPPIACDGTVCWQLLIAMPMKSAGPAQNLGS